MIEAVRIDYLFSFAFNRIPFGTKVKGAGGEDGAGGEESLGDYLVKQILIHSPDHYHRIEHHKSEEREPEDNRSALYMYFHHLSIDGKREEVIAGDLKEASCFLHAAIFESGMGLLQIMIEPKTPPHQDLLAKIAGGFIYPCITTSDPTTGNAQTRTLQQVFSDAINSIRNHLKTALRSLSQESMDALRQEGVRDLVPLAFRDNNQWKASEDYSIEWLDSISGHFWFSNEKESPLGTGAFEIPCVVISIKTAPKIRDTFNEQALSEDKTRALQLVGKLLHDFDLAHLSPGKSLHDRPQWLKFPMLDPEFLVFQSAKRLIIVHSESFESPDYRNFAWGVFRTYCAARGTWHLYILFNEMLDESIAKIASDYQPEAIADKELSVIAVTGYFLKNLAVEDPFVRAVGLTPLANLYYECAFTFGLKDLRKLIEFKLEKIDALYNMKFSHRARIEYGQPHQRKQYELWLSFLFVLLAGVSALGLSNWISLRYYLTIAAVFLLGAVLLWLSWFLGSPNKKAKV